MVGIAQLAERLVVVQKVAGSTPVTHPDVKAARCSGAAFTRSAVPTPRRTTLRGAPHGSRGTSERTGTTTEARHP